MVAYGHHMRAVKLTLAFLYVPLAFTLYTGFSWAHQDLFSSTAEKSSLEMLPSRGRTLNKENRFLPNYQNLVKVPRQDQKRWSGTDAGCRSPPGSSLCYKSCQCGCMAGSPQRCLKLNMDTERKRQAFTFEFSSRQLILCLIYKEKSYVIN